MTKSERRWLRGSVLLGILIATVTVVALVMIAGAASSQAFSTNSLTGMANSTCWNTFNAISGISIIDLLPWVIVGIIALLIFLVIVLSFTASFAGMAN
jgi:disulfide bond formation protein DsbB